MPLTIPNVFGTGTVINGSLIEQNNATIKSFINGGITVGELNPAAVIQPQHVMNGEYLPTNIDYDMTSGHEIGAQELPVMLVGVLPRYWAKTPRAPRSIPRTGTTFYMKTSGTVLIRFDAYVKGYESETVAPITSAEANMWIALDGTYYPETKFVFEEESDWGTSFAGGLFPSWEKRRAYNGHYALYNVGAGEHTVSLLGNADSQAFFIRNLSFTIEVHYD